jgi:hypothetical protein
MSNSGAKRLTELLVKQLLALIFSLIIAGIVVKCLLKALAIIC